MIDYRIGNYSKMNNLNEDSPTLTLEDINKINKFLKIKLKRHQETSVKNMLNLEADGGVKIKINSYVSKNMIYSENNPHYGWYDYNLHRRREVQYTENDFIVNTNFGILADKVGSGKTFDIIGMICHTRIPIDRPKIMSSSYYSSVLHIDNEKCIPTNLIILPHNLTAQWKKAFEFTKLKVYTISKRAHIDKLLSVCNIYEDIIHEEKDNKDTNDTNDSKDNKDTNDVNNVKDVKDSKDSKEGKKLKEIKFTIKKQTNDSDSDMSSIGIDPEQCVGFYDVILLSATMMDDFYTKFPHIKYSRIIIDEVTTIKKLPMSFDIKSNFVWYISATPTSILLIRKNYIRDMVSNMNSVIFNKIIIKNNDGYITDSMKLPVMKQIIIHCDTPASLRAIREFIPQEVMNMLNAGNIKEAVVKLNCNIDTDENIISVLTSRTEKELHNKKKELDYQKNIIPNDIRAHAENIKRIQERIKSLETKLESIKERIKSFADDNCPICMDTFTSPAVLPCSHVYCLACLTLVKNSKCPMCANPFELKQLHIIDNDSKPKSDSDEKSKEKKLLSKKDNLINIINKKKDGRFLVFSNYDATNDNIGTFLKASGIVFGKLMGNGNVINSTIEKFKNGEIRVLILNAQHYGSGLNLQMATDIVIYHEMNKELETQVIGRSQRMGRTQPLNVYYLLYDSERSNCTNPSLDLNIYDENDTELCKLLAESSTNYVEDIIDINIDYESDSSDTVKPKKGRKKVVV